MLREIWTAFRLRLLALRRRRQLDADLQEEIAFHMALREENKSGRPFGNPVLVKEDLREMWTFRGLESWWQDARYGTRTLRKSPAFTLVAVLSLAIGIGGNTAVFSLADAILLRSLPVREPKQLRLIYWKGTVHMPAGSNPRTAAALRGFHRTVVVFASDSYQQIAAGTPQFSDIAAFGGQSPYPVHAHGGGPHLAQTSFVSGNFFRTLGVNALVGRTLLPVDDRREAAVVAVISYRYWQNHFGLEPKIVGNPITINGRDVAVIGVTPKGFDGVEAGYPTDCFLTLSALMELDNPHGKCFDQPGALWLQLIGRLNTAVTDHQAFEGLRMAMARVDDSAPGVPGNAEPWIPELHPGRSGTLSLRNTQSDILLILGGAAGFILMIACLNLANLLLARAATRRREIAVRLSIGASRGRVMRQLLIESLIIAGVGAGIGILFAHPLAAKIAGLAGGLEVVVDTRLSARVLLFAAAITILTTILFGVLPALRGTRMDLTPALKQGSGDLGTVRRNPRLSQWLLCGQVALSTLLLAGAMLFTRTLVNLNQVHLGFEVNNLLMFRVDGQGAGYHGTELARTYQRIREKVAAVPGVKDVAFMDARPFAYGGMVSLFTIDGDAADHRAFIQMVGSGFMRTMGVRLLNGRDIDERDEEGAPLAAIVNETFAGTYMQGSDPVGRVLSWSLPNEKSNKAVMRIVGVCSDMRYNSLRKEVPATVFLAYSQNPKLAGQADFAVRSWLPLGSIAKAVIGAVADAEHDIPVGEMRTENEQIATMIGSERLFAALAGSFAIVAALLVAIGLYGLMSYLVTSRTREIGVRVALGAGLALVRWMVLREALTTTAIGMVVGVPVALWLATIFQKRLFGVGSGDAPSYIAAAATMLFVAAAAAWIPARRASRIDPAVALRGE